MHDTPLQSAGQSGVTKEHSSHAYYDRLLYKDRRVDAPCFNLYIPYFPQLWR